MTGADRQRQRRPMSAMDVYIEQRDAQIDDLARRVAMYEEKARVNADLRRREEGGPWTGSTTR